MQMVLSFPDISPEIFSIDLGGFSFALRWYALAYITGILLGWQLARATVRRARLWPRDTAPMTPEAVEELITSVILGIILGGRLGFVLFYQPAYYLANPIEIPMIWQGGMSFHGGMLGVTVAGLLFARRHGVPLLSICDLMALCTPPGLFLGRIANFINAELWGRPSDLPWAVIFPGQAAQDCPGVEGLCARHPSQLYEAGLEGLLLGGLLVFLAYRRGWLKRPGQIMGLFVAGYGTARFLVEFVRQADAQFITPDNPLGHVVQLGALGVSMGQLLSLPMIVLGLGLIAFARARRAPTTA
ncbi:prolipoprotein diacylglyceryl transferase [Oceaniglobus roseus]|uniref:prolipoprotein diacylglyceryl transferase n=1 Tax=Oceaniglobus roseus TaxID=1737570 RepID=UPI000C7EFBAF|nr:prolipoprotein diacylglyceryl transferase [Kandeliimicrobium roseum]